MISIERIISFVLVCFFLVDLSMPACGATTTPLTSKAFIKATSSTLKNWNAFKDRYEKVYTSVEEENYRFSVWKENQDLIKLYSSTDPNAKYGNTKFADLTPEEFKEIYCHFEPQESIKEMFVGAYTAKRDIPDAIDWREKNMVNPIKDQGDCGSCWAFSAVETAWALVGNALTNFSEQQLVDCSTANAGCEGGFPPSAYEYIMANGIESMEEYPYAAADQTCVYDSARVVGHISSYLNITTDEEIMLEAIQDGVLSIGVNAFKLQFYEGGVMGPTGCPESSLLTDHGVALVGYNTTAEVPYWILRNSWGTSWGEAGYARVELYSNVCGLKNWPTIAYA